MKEINSIHWNGMRPLQKQKSKNESQILNISVPLKEGVSLLIIWFGRVVIFIWV